MKNKLLYIAAISFIVTSICAGIIIQAYNNNEDIQNKAVLVMCYEK